MKEIVFFFFFVEEPIEALPFHIEKNEVICTKLTNFLREHAGNPDCKLKCRRKLANPHRGMSPAMSAATA